MALVVVGVVLLILCAVLLLVRRSQQGKLSEIMATETSTSRQLAETAKYVAERMGEAGSFNQITEIKGLARCDSPLTSEVAKQPCVYYSMSVSREYEETYWETDQQTKQQVSKTRRSSEVVASNSQRIPFFVEDSTGQVLVDPAGADVDAVQVVDRFEPGENTMSLGALRIDLGDLLPLGSGRHTIGYKISEKIIPLDRSVYVLGEAVDSTGKVTMLKPREKGKKFLISHKSEEELVRSTGSTIRWLLVG
nr:E3 ubiquitin ligase family protein [Dehalococcoidales bacterium]